jgi:N-acetylglucosaminyl-diphospho-decaprenol L-rhamnosyltransferase
MNSITLSIVSHGHGPLLSHLLDDLARADLGLPHRVIVTLNLPDEAFEPSAWPNLDIVVLRNPQPRGFGANHNAAFARCETPWFAVLNPDLRLPDNPFPILLAQAGTRSKIGVIAPRIVDSSGKAEDSLRANLTPWSLLLRKFDSNAGRADDALSPGRRSAFFWLAGMFLVFPADVFHKIGGFDERFFLYCEDYDICARLYGSGYYVVIEPGAVAVHDAQRDSRRSTRHLGWHLASLFRVWTSSAFWRVTLAMPKARIANERS